MTIHSSASSHQVDTTCRFARVERCSQGRGLMRTFVAAAVMLASLSPLTALAQSGAPRTAAPRPQPPPETAKPPAPATGVVTGADFVIGPQDVLGVLFWKDQEMSGDVTVRPDGMITLPLIRDIPGRRPQACRAGGSHPAGRPPIHLSTLGHGCLAPDEQPEGLHHGRGQSAWCLSACHVDDRHAAHRHRRRAHRVCRARRTSRSCACRGARPRRSTSTTRTWRGARTGSRTLR